jgi:hypothetical protein
MVRTKRKVVSMDNFPVSGKPIPDIDLTKVNHREWRALFDQAQSNTDGDAILARACGMTVEEVGDLNFYDFRALFRALVDKASKPLENDEKNSAGASTKP